MINITSGGEIILAAAFGKLEISLEVPLGASGTFFGSRIDKFASVVTMNAFIAVADRSAAAKS